MRPFPLEPMHPCVGQQDGDGPSCACDDIRGSGLIYSILRAARELLRLFGRRRWFRVGDPPWVRVAILTIFGWECQDRHPDPREGPSARNHPRTTPVIPAPVNIIP